MRELTTQELDSVQGGVVPFAVYAVYQSAVYVGGAFVGGAAAGFVTGVVYNYLHS